MTNDSDKESDTRTTDPKYDWKLKNKIVHTIVGAGGTIFGGAVRDCYIHDMNAKQYYDAVSLEVDEARYNDPIYKPEYVGRTVIPQDIDMTIHQSKLDNLMDKLTKSHFRPRRVFSRDASRYIPLLNVHEGDVIHQRWKVHPVCMNNVNVHLNSMFPYAINYMPEVSQIIDELLKKIDNMQLAPVVLDIMVIQVPLDQPQPEAPFGNIDFECNGLLMDANGIRISRTLKSHVINPIDRQIILNRILDDILKNKAKTCQEHMTPYRMQKMLKKNWTMSSLSSNVEIRQQEYDGICIICLSHVQHRHYRLKCCDARYHLHCMKNAFTVGPACVYERHECPMCRKRMNEHDVASDISFINCVETALTNPLPNYPRPYNPQLENAVLEEVD